MGSHNDSTWACNRDTVHMMAVDLEEIAVLHEATASKVDGVMIWNHPDDASTDFHLRTMLCVHRSHTQCEGDGDVVGVVGVVTVVAKVVLHGIQVVEVGMLLRVHQWKKTGKDKLK